MANSARVSAAGPKAHTRNDSPTETGERGNPKGVPEGKTREANAGVVSSEERHQMIAVAAYYLAERRGFCPGYEIEDWLAAQEEVDQRLSNGASR